MSDGSWERCPHRKDDGDRCGSRTNLNPESGLCIWHDPERADERRYMQRQGGKAAAKARNRAEAEGLAASELPPLVDHEAAEDWADAIGRAAATGRLSSSAAQAALRAVREWRESRDASEASEHLEKLMDALAEWRRTGDSAPVLELVKDAS